MFNNSVRFGDTAMRGTAFLDGEQGAYPAVTFFTLAAIQSPGLSRELNTSFNTMHQNLVLPSRVNINPSFYILLVINTSTLLL